MKDVTHAKFLRMVGLRLRFQSMPFSLFLSLCLQLVCQGLIILLESFWFCCVLLSAIYMLWMVERVFFGKLEHEENKKLQDLGLREVLILVPLCLAMIGIGVYPKPIMNKMHSSTEAFLKLTMRTDAKASAQLLTPSHQYMKNDARIIKN